MRAITVQGTAEAQEMSVTEHKEGERRHPLLLLFALRLIHLIIRLRMQVGGQGWFSVRPKTRQTELSSV